jgi:hypothetical protein
MKGFNASIAFVLFNDPAHTGCPNVSVQVTFRYFREEEYVGVITIITYIWVQFRRPVDVRMSEIRGRL